MNTPSDYLSFCEYLWDQWRTERLQPAPELRKRFDLEYAPEPYLVFGEGSNPLHVLLTNPGGPMPHQHISELGDSSQYGILARDSYARNARKLGSFYNSPDFKDFEGANPGNAHRRIQKMLFLAKWLGYDSVFQLEALPFHSRSLGDKERIIKTGMDDHLLSDYINHVRAFLADRTVLSVSGCGLKALMHGAAGLQRSGPWIAWIADQMRMDWSHVSQHEVVFGPKDNPTSTTGAFLKDTSTGKLKGIYAVMGSNNLPKEARLPKIVAAWNMPV